MRLTFPLLGKVYGGNIFSLTSHLININVILSRRKYLFIKYDDQSREKINLCYFH